MSEKFNIDIRSEIGTLEGVILHQPGPEIENMTPENAGKSLYSDILNLDVAKKEYAQLKGVLNKVTKTFEVTDLLTEVLKNEKVKTDLITKICQNEGCEQELDYLLSLKEDELTRQLFEGVLIKRDNLTRFLNKDRYSLTPLPNFFFTRDASVSVLNEVLICKMASKVRDREAFIMEAIFDHHPMMVTKTFNPLNSKDLSPKLTIEGGDVLIAREDILLIGVSARTSSQGIDFIIETLKNSNEKRHVIVQELPDEPESFIHLDMVFTFLDTDKCMAYEPLILNSAKYSTIHIEIENGAVSQITEENTILTALKKLGMDLKPIPCGGNKDLYSQEREQWHSGANFFAMGPGKIIGYSRNVNTINALAENGFTVVKAEDVISDKVDLNTIERYVVTIDGAELARGGGGCRCMTMPIGRKTVEWK